MGHPPIPATLPYFSYIFLQNLANCLHEKQKRWLVEKGDSPSLVILLRRLGHPTWRANFSPYKHFWLGQPGQLGEGEMIRACASAVGAGKGCTILWYKWPVHDPVLMIPPPPLDKAANNTRPCSKLGGTTLNGREEGGGRSVLQTCD